MKNSVLSITVHLYSQSQPCVLNDVVNAYTKDCLYCVKQKSGDVTKFPVLHVFRIIEKSYIKEET